MVTSSSQSSLSPVNAAVESFLSKIKPFSVINIAFSGGLDSTVLLHAFHKAIQNKEHKFKLKAIYVDHGLQAESKIWSVHCKQFCDDLDLEFICLTIELGSFSRKGLEATAREERYKSISQFIENASVIDESCLITGHHQRDQAETLLLNLFRGAGINGLAAMPFCKDIHTENGFVVKHYRPLLQVPYDELTKYAKCHQLRYINDQTNEDTQFRRNFVRHDVLTLIESLWPGVQTAISNAANHMQEAAELMDGIAQKSLEESSSNNCFISLQQDEDTAWIEQKNTIRFWFKQNWPEVVLSSIHYEWIRLSWLNYTNSQNKKFSYKLSKGELRVYKNRLYFLKNQPVAFSIKLQQVADLFEYDTGGLDFFSFKNIPLESAVNAVLRSISKADEVDKKILKAFFQSYDIPFWERKVWPVLELNNGDVVVLGCEKCTAISSFTELFPSRQIGLSFSKRMELMKIT